jgi:hypothetical protein
MTILWFGGEDIDFPNGSTVEISTGGSGYYRTNYSRCAVKCNAQYSTAKSTIFPGGAVTSCWFTAYLDGGQPGASNLLRGIGLGESSSGLGLFIGVVNNNAILYGPGGSTLCTGTGELLPYSNNARLDVQVSNFGASATVVCYVNYTLTFTYNGDVRNGTAMAGFDSIFMGMDSAYCNAWFVSEIIVATTDTRTMSLRTRYPTADGTTHDMTGAYSDVDEITINDADVIYTNTADKDQQCEISDLPAGTFAVLATKIAVRACKSEDASIDKIKLGYLSDGTVAVGSAQSLTTSWDTYEEIFATNPVTLSAWLQSEQNALQVNVRSSA